MTNKEIKTLIIGLRKVNDEYTERGDMPNPDIETACEVLEAIMNDSNDSLLCVEGNCLEPQGADGEYCEKHGK